MMASFPKTNQPVPLVVFFCHDYDLLLPVGNLSKT
jgi:hypothetical protein